MNIHHIIFIPILMFFIREGISNTNSLDHQISLPCFVNDIEVMTYKV